MTFRCWVCNSAFEKNFVRDRPQSKFRTAIATARGFIRIKGSDAKYRNNYVMINHEKSNLHAISTFSVKKSLEVATAEALQQALSQQGQINLIQTVAEFE